MKKGRECTCGRPGQARICDACLKKRVAAIRDVAPEIGLLGKSSDDGVNETRLLIIQAVSDGSRLDLSHSSEEKV